MNVVCDTDCSASEFPAELRPCQLLVDRKAETLLIPIAGQHVPFHISTIKSVSKAEEGPVTFLRINFYAPGVSHGKDVSPSMMAAMAANPDAMYIRMINIKSKVWPCFVVYAAVLTSCIVVVSAGSQEHQHTVAFDQGHAKAHAISARRGASDT